MTLTAHAAVGAVIGSAAGNPLLGFSLGFVSHFLIDLIPHGDSGMSDNFRVHKVKQKRAVAFALIDAIVAMFFIMIILNTKSIENIQAVSWGIAGSVLPDLLVGLHDVTKARWLPL